MKSLTTFSLLLTVLFTSCNKTGIEDIVKAIKHEPAHPPVSSNSPWETFIGNDPSVRALPDIYSNYFAFSFDRTQANNKYIGIRVKGKFGYARYMSYNLYDAKKGITFGGFTDTALVADPGSINPFNAYADPNADKRNYSLVVVPKGYPVTTPEKNIFTYDSDSINIISLMIRYYVPQGSETAGVQLPSVETFDVRTGKQVPTPQTYSIQNDGVPAIVYTYRMSPIWQTTVDDTVRFYHATGAGQFNNADNIYLISALKRLGSEVFLFRFKPPTFRPDGSTDPNKDVRYWSINEGSYNTTTPFGIKDADFKRAADGFVYVAIGDNNIKAKANQAGYNFMPWSVKEPIMALVYRNMLSDPSFPGFLGKVPRLDLSNKRNIYDQNARYFIGDYAPQGIKMNKSSFMHNYGGWPAPGF